MKYPSWWKIVEFYKHPDLMDNGKLAKSMTKKVLVNWEKRNPGNHETVCMEETANAKSEMKSY